MSVSAVGRSAPLAAKISVRQSAPKASTAPSLQPASRVSAAPVAQSASRVSATPVVQSAPATTGMTGSALSASSGSGRVDALVYGGTNLWWGDKSKDGGKSYQLTYSMLGRSLDSTATDKDKSGYRPMTSVQTAAVTKALAYISSVINVKFTPGKAGQSDINFGTNKQNGTSAGYANPPNASGEIGRAHV